MAHKVVYCDKCNKIFAALMLQGAYIEDEGIRFNQLEKLTGLATQTFSNHIQHLIDTNIVSETWKEKKKGKQNRSFSLNLSPGSQLFSEKDFELTMEIIKRRAKVYRTWTSEEIIGGLMAFSKLLELQTTKIWLQSQLPKANKERLEMQAKIAGTFYSLHRNFLRDAMKNRSNFWHKEAVRESPVKRQRFFRPYSLLLFIMIYF